MVKDPLVNRIAKSAKDLSARMNSRQLHLDIAALLSDARFDEPKLYLVVREATSKGPGQITSSIREELKKSPQLRLNPDYIYVYEPNQIPAKELAGLAQIPFGNPPKRFRDQFINGEDFDEVLLLWTLNP